MVILTTPNIKKFNPIRQSSTENWAYQDFCLAEVPNDFKLTEKQMIDNKISFWWMLQDGHFDVEEFDYDEFSPTNNVMGLVETIAWTYNVSKEVNLAMAIHVVSHNILGCPFEMWEKYNQAK